MNPKANNLLAWIILFISLACFNLYFIEAVSLNTTFWVIIGAILPLVVIMPIGPLIYFYAKATLNTNTEINQRNRKHFYSVVLDLFPYILSLILIICSILGLLEFNTFDWNNFIYQYNKYVDIPRWISLTAYIIVTLKMITRFKVQNKNKEVYNWVKQFTMGFLIFSIIWLLHLIPYIIPYFSNKLLGAVGWYPVYMPLIVLIYWLGINGYIISFKYFKTNAKDKNLSHKIIIDTSKALENAMLIDELFLNPNLKLNDVVKHTKISQKIISEVLNQHLGKSFNEYVNGFRVEAFKKRLLENKDKNLTITGIALECGFNSQATFQRTFKSMTNMTPKEFQQQ